MRADCSKTITLVRKGKLTGDAGVAPQLGGGRQRLLSEHVQRGGPEPTGLERGQQVRLGADGTAADVDQPRRLAPRQRVPALLSQPSGVNSSVPGQKTTCGGCSREKVDDIVCCLEEVPQLGGAAVPVDRGAGRAGRAHKPPHLTSQPCSCGGKQRSSIARNAAHSLPY